MCIEDLGGAGLDRRDARIIAATQDTASGHIRRDAQAIQQRFGVVDQRIGRWKRGPPSCMTGPRAPRSVPRAPTPGRTVSTLG